MTMGDIDQEVAQRRLTFHGTRRPNVNNRPSSHTSHIWGIQIQGKVVGEVDARFEKIDVGDTGHRTEVLLAPTDDAPLKVAKPGRRCLTWSKMAMEKVSTRRIRQNAQQLTNELKDLRCINPLTHTRPEHRFGASIRFPAPQSGYYVQFQLSSHTEGDDLFPQSILPLDPPTKEGILSWLQRVTLQRVQAWSASRAPGILGKKEKTERLSWAFENVHVNDRSAFAACDTGRRLVDCRGGRGREISR
ncbi:hypothetical protein DFP72DRAFT_856854 [Ephemerocybe angulata]|uniref:Uncharacterized protein n=1 Tax=Ephemerocybe angulata TaxID=980116 RepID=A0A8H6HF35_9AGAR|nr:hypothetical protein DFP72DRAFT_856854 [Tulosesus angulatus]